MDITEFSFLKTIFIILAAITFLILVISTITFIIEKEKKAALRSLFLNITVPSLIILPIILNIQIILFIALIVFGISILAFISILLPINNISYFIDPEPTEKHDERNIMFSRGELIDGSDRFKKYYEAHPENKLSDDTFRKNPGLLSEFASYYHPFIFKSAKTNFKVIKAFHDICDGEVNGKKTIYVPKDLKNYITKWAKNTGAHSVGFTLLKDYHLYSFGGRNHNYDKKILNNHKYAIALTVEMDYNQMGTAPKSPVINESSYQYLRSGTIAVQLASFIRELGYSASAHIDAHFEVICPLVARDAGLGEIGRMGLLMTPELGPRNRIAVITTDLELDVDKRKADFSMIDFCNVCKKCDINCPANAIPSENREEINGVQRWKINSEACYTYWTKVGTDCGRCMIVCPYSHPDYFMHKLIRYFVKRSFLFRRFAIFMDDFFYGRRPISKELKF